VTVSRLADEDLSGGYGNDDEVGVLSLSQVVHDMTTRGSQDLLVSYSSEPVGGRSRFRCTWCLDDCRWRCGTRGLGGGKPT
jgi:hypothetical protein